MNDDEVRQAMAALETYRVQLETLAQQAQILTASAEEAARARETLNAYAKASEGDEIMVPVGASSFVTARVAPAPKAVVSIGNRISVEKTLDEAIAYMESNLAEIRDALTKVNETIGEMDTAYRNLQVAVQQEYQRRQQ